MSAWKGITITFLASVGAAFIVGVAVPDSLPGWIETVLMCVAAFATSTLVGRELIRS